VRACVGCFLALESNPHLLDPQARDGPQQLCGFARLEVARPQMRLVPQAVHKRLWRRAAAAAAGVTRVAGMTQLGQAPDTVDQLFVSHAGQLRGSFLQKEQGGGGGDRGAGFAEGPEKAVHLCFIVWVGVSVWVCMCVRALVPACV
jgi:hypothetical protein